MIMNLTQPIEKDKPFPASLTFQTAGTVEIEFAVEAVGATQAPKRPTRIIDRAASAVRVRPQNGATSVRRNGARRRRAAPR